MSSFSRLIPTLLREANKLRVSSSVLNSKHVLGSSQRFHSTRTFGRPKTLCWQNQRFTTKIHRELLVANSVKVCSTAAVHTAGDKELQDFLTEEIAAETKAQKFPKLPNVDNFEVQNDGSDVKLTRKFNEETITVKLNVNHSVDTELPGADVNVNKDKAEVGEMKSKPDFTVDISKGGKVLSFKCTFVHQDQEEPEGDEPFDDLFNIDEVAMHDGEWKDTTYAVSGEIMDGYLYDLLMNYLEDRGISNEFAEKLSDYSTAYEHKLYIGMLENLKSFFGKK